MDNTEEILSTKLLLSTLLNASPTATARNVETSIRHLITLYEADIKSLKDELFLAQMGHRAVPTDFDTTLPLFRIGARVWQAPDSSWTETAFHKLIQSALPATTLDLIEQRGFKLVQDGGPTKPAVQPAPRKVHLLTVRNNTGLYVSAVCATAQLAQDKIKVEGCKWVHVDEMCGPEWRMIVAGVVYEITATNMVEA